MAYKDASGRKIREPIDYLIEASKKSRKLCIALHLSEHEDLTAEAEALEAKIQKAIDETPIEVWETERAPVQEEA